MINRASKNLPNPKTKLLDKGVVVYRSLSKSSFSDALSSIQNMMKLKQLYLSKFEDAQTIQEKKFIFLFFLKEFQVEIHECDQSFTETLELLFDQLPLFIKRELVHDAQYLSEHLIRLLLVSQCKTLHRTKEELISVQHQRADCETDLSKLESKMKGHVETIEELSRKNMELRSKLTTSSTHLENMIHHFDAVSPCKRKPTEFYLSSPSQESMALDVSDNTTINGHAGYANILKY